jgi:hypothetical protein
MHGHRWCLRVTDIPTIALVVVGHTFLVVGESGRSRNKVGEQASYRDLESNEKAPEELKKTRLRKMMIPELVLRVADPFGLTVHCWLRLI